MRAIDLLHELTDDHGAGRIGELLELAEMFADRAARAGALERRADEQRALDGRLNYDGFAGYCSFLNGPCPWS
jgi:hypothetical protein